MDTICRSSRAFEAQSSLDASASRCRTCTHASRRWEESSWLTTVTRKMPIAEHMKRNLSHTDFNPQRDQTNMSVHEDTRKRLSHMP